MQLKTIPEILLSGGKSITSVRVIKKFRPGFFLTSFAVLLLLNIFSHNPVHAQTEAVAREYQKIFTTYPFSDPDPVPVASEKIYPYFRFDGYTDDPIKKDWKVVELENDFIKVMILPEIGGKIWTAIEKSTGKSFIYYNHVVKFRDIAMRGPWTSGGIEANYGIIGHTPNCATPVDYTIVKKSDGSVSCVIGVLDLLTRTTWRIDINLQKDKAYFTTSSFWYNASPLEQPYYTWMNAAIKAEGNLQFIFPGTHHLGHEGDVGSWPVDEEGRKISFYNNNDFGTYKSYHVFGKYSDFFGGYWHDDDFGMGRYAPYDEKPGRKIWIWGLSQEGMIWEKLLTDNDGQYVEVQSGRLFNQAAGKSTFSPFKHKGFQPFATDTWTENWFPVLKTKGFVKANHHGVLNMKRTKSGLKIWFSPLQPVRDKLKITRGDSTVYSKKLDLNTLELFVDSIQLNTEGDNLKVTLGGNKLVYHSSPESNVLSRPVEFPEDFDWNSVYGLFVLGKEDIRQRNYAAAEEKLRACLDQNPHYLPALSNLAMVLYKKMHYEEALEVAKKALAINTYEPAANYYYGLINDKLGNTADAKDGFSIASMDPGFRNASYTALSALYLREGDYQRTIECARKSIGFNRYAVDSWQHLAVVFRNLENRKEAEKALDTLLSFDPLNHFARFEKYLWENSEESKNEFLRLIRSDLPHETFLELALWYYHTGCREEAVKMLHLSPPAAQKEYWLALLENRSLDFAQLKPDFAFPFRPETAEILEELIESNDHWLPKFHLALICWNSSDTDRAGKLFSACGNEPDYAPFYASRAAFLRQNAEGKETTVSDDLKKATGLDSSEWRYGKNLAEFYLSDNQPDQAEVVATEYYRNFPDNYVIGLIYTKTLLQNAKYERANTVLKNINVLPNEGATEGRRLYKETQLMLALNEMKKENFKKALSHVTLARLWPENLGVGRPYEEDIDERPEDWLAFQNHKKLGNRKAAGQLLEKIISSEKHLNETGEIRSSVNNLITAWAMKETENTARAEKFLNEWLENNPEDHTAKWVSNVFHGKSFEGEEAVPGDENYRILNRLLRLNFHNR